MNSFTWPFDFSIQPDATFTVNELSVFSAGEEGSVGLIVKVDVYLTYLLIKDEIGDLYDQLALKFNEPIIDRAQEAIKNEAANVPFTDYLENRTNVEERFRQAVQRQWQKTPSLHCELDQFHLGRVQIPESGKGYRHGILTTTKWIYPWFLSRLDSQ